MKKRAQGWGTRYDVGSSGHLDNVRARSGAVGMYHDYTKRHCTRCRLFKPKKGGKYSRDRARFFCAECVRTVSIASGRRGATGMAP